METSFIHASYALRLIHMPAAPRHYGCYYYYYTLSFMNRGGGGRKRRRKKEPYYEDGDVLRRRERERKQNDTGEEKNKKKRPLGKGGDKKRRRKHHQGLLFFFFLSFSPHTVMLCLARDAKSSRRARSDAGKLLLGRGELLRVGPTVGSRSSGSQGMGKKRHR